MPEHCWEHCRPNDRIRYECYVCQKAYADHRFWWARDLLVVYCGGGDGVGGDGYFMFREGFFDAFIL